MVVNLFNFLYTFAAGKIVTLNQINMITKNKMKNYLKLGVFLFGMSIVLTNCLRDNTLEHSTQKRVHAKRISLKDFK